MIFTKIRRTVMITGAILVLSVSTLTAMSAGASPARAATHANTIQAEPAQAGAYSCGELPIGAGDDPNGTNYCAIWDFYTLNMGQDISVCDNYPSGPGLLCTELLMQNDGNLVVYHWCTAIPTWHARWASNTVGTGYNTDMQGDGNLVVYATGGIPVWASNTSGHTDAWLAVQGDGNVVIYATPDPPISAYPSAIWSTGTEVSNPAISC